MGELSRRMNAEEMDFAQAQMRVNAGQLAALISRITDNTLSNNAAKQVLDALWNESKVAVGDNSNDMAQAASVIDSIIEVKGLKQMNDTGALEAIIDEVLAANPKNVEEYKAGNAKALNGLVGHIMKASKGKANPAQVNALLLKKLG